MVSSICPVLPQAIPVAKYTKDHAMTAFHSIPTLFPPFPAFFGSRDGFSFYTFLTMVYFKFPSCSSDVCAFSHSNRGTLSFSGASMLLSPLDPRICRTPISIACRTRWMTYRTSFKCYGALAAWCSAATVLHPHDIMIYHV